MLNSRIYYIDYFKIMSLGHGNLIHSFWSPPERKIPAASSFFLIKCEYSLDWLTARAQYAT